MPDRGALARRRRGRAPRGLPLHRGGRGLAGGLGSSHRARRGVGRILSAVTTPIADTAPFPPVATADPVRGAAFLAELRTMLPDLRILTDAADTESYRWDETEYMH